MTLADDVLEFRLTRESVEHYLTHWDRILILTMADGEPVITLANADEEPSTTYPGNPIPLRTGDMITIEYTAIAS